ncbi:MAG: Dabb family protein [Cyanobacteriota bacterium]|nr:Dabb family protein [Cyanobacteriota bacterium]
MIEHIVLFKWKPETPDDAIATVMDELKGLKHKIPEIVEISCGENFSDRAQGFQHGLIVRFRNRKDLEIYQPHPAHTEVIQNLIQPILAGILAVDYEVI